MFHFPDILTVVTGSTALVLLFEASNHGDKSDKIVDKAMFGITEAGLSFLGGLCH